MDLNLLTIARRANLGSKIQSSFANANQRIADLESLNNKIEISDEFDEIEKLRSREFSVISLVSITEQVLNEVLHQVLVAYPHKFGNKKFEIDELLEEGSILELFYKKANQKLLDLAYGKFDKFIKSFEEHLELKERIDPELTNSLNEVKCTRDCLIHSAGKSSDTYLSKAGEKARAYTAGEKLLIDQLYLNNSISITKSFLNIIYNNIPDKVIQSNKTFIFKQMWEATCLNRRIKFETVWTIINKNEVMPVEIKKEYGFSSSEMAVYNLFRHIYNRDFWPVDISYYFMRWKPQSKEYQIAISWLDNQFYF